MRAYSLLTAGGFAGYCLRTCRRAWGLPPHAPSAVAEWDSISLKHRHTYTAATPIGAPVFWDTAIGKFGHVAIQSAKAGYIWSTMNGRFGDRVKLVPISFFHVPPAGWSDLFCGESLPLNEIPKR